MLKRLRNFIIGVPASSDTDLQNSIPKYLAFDLETAKEFPEGEDWQNHRPLGISCAAARSNCVAEPMIWHGSATAGQPSAKMSREEVRILVQTLVSYVNEKGYTLVTWNGLSFDLPILAEESGLVSECKELATHHVDMMFHVMCLRGHFLGLDNAAKGMGLEGKTAGMSGADAPRLWAEGRYKEVLDYLAQDVRTTCDLALFCQEKKVLRWTSPQGNLQRIDLHTGWLTVANATKLPEPDTSWMTDPPKRGDFLFWLSQSSSDE